MNKDEIRRLREALFVLREQLLRNLLFDALKSEQRDRLNFFRVYSGSLMDGIVIDWWKVFGNRKEPSHWKALLPQQQHDDISFEISEKLANLEPSEDFKAVWNCAERYRNTAAAHLDYDEPNRAQVYPSLEPLRVSAEIIYRRVFDILQAQGCERGHVSPERMTGSARANELAYYKRMCGDAREALEEYNNSFLE